VNTSLTVRGGSPEDVMSLPTDGWVSAGDCFYDYGHRELTWHTHCNNLHTRWSRCRHSITITGPPDRGPPSAWVDVGRS
jgi:hypothetical protein